MVRVSRPSLRSLWSEGISALGVSARIASPLAAEIIARAGFDYITLDAQHGEAGFDMLMQLATVVEAAGVTPLVRVPGSESWMIQRALDLGVRGVIVPAVEDADQCRVAVAACRYPPLGERSFGPLRADGARHGDDPLCIVQIETGAGVAQAESIVSVPGLDGVYIGPVDLGMSLGLERGAAPKHPMLLNAIADVERACAHHGVVAGRPASTIDEVGAAIQEGCLFVTVAIDTEYLQRGAGDQLAAIRDCYFPAR
jgi:4-hydroxy-2-oxoheptanedioate aldolase